jgi:type II secretory pathway pseudopilin PulG
MSFRLPAILWAFALLAAGMASFGVLGIPLTLFVIAAWAHAFVKIRITLVELLVIIVILGVLVGLLIPATQAARESHRFAACRNNVHQVARALEMWIKDHGALPAAAAPQAAGEPARSWRLRLLPQLDEQSLFDAYHHDEPWDGPHNLALSQSGVGVYACPGDPPVSLLQPHTNYFAIVDQRAAFLPDRDRPMSEITDDLSRTILLLEAAGRDTPWPKPEDLTIEEAHKLLTDASADAIVHHYFRAPGFFYKNDQSQVVNVVFANGTVSSLELPLSNELATALLTIDGGETIDEQELSRTTEPQLDYAKCYSFGTFVLLALLPAYRLLRRSPLVAA